MDNKRGRQAAGPVARLDKTTIVIYIKLVKIRQFDAGRDRLAGGAIMSRENMSRDEDRELVRRAIRDEDYYFDKFQDNSEVFTDGLSVERVIEMMNRSDSDFVMAEPVVYTGLHGETLGITDVLLYFRTSDGSLERFVFCCGGGCNEVIDGDRPLWAEYSKIPGSVWQPLAAGFVLQRDSQTKGLVAE